MEILQQYLSICIFVYLLYKTVSFVTAWNKLQSLQLLIEHYTYKKPTAEHILHNVVTGDIAASRVYVLVLLTLNKHTVSIVIVDSYKLHDWTVVQGCQK